MANLIPMQLDKDTGKTVLSRQGLGSGGVGNLPPGFFQTLGYVHVESIASNAWVIAHGAGLLNFQVQIFDSNNRLIIPDEVITVDANLIHIIHNAPIIGKAVFTFINDV